MHMYVFVHIAMQLIPNVIAYLTNYHSLNELSY